MEKIIAFVPVRGGSKSIPNKNIKDFCGKPLVFWCLSALHDVALIDEIVVATDSQQIASIVLSFNFLKVKIYYRSMESATDTATTEFVMLEYIQSNNLNRNDIFVLVQATSPMTNSNNFTEALDIYNQNDFDSILTCTRNYRFFWSVDGVSINYDYKSRPRRQDFGGILMENGAFYISRIGKIIESKNRLSGKIGIYEMPKYTAIELDEPEDWIILENIMYKYVLPLNLNRKIKLVLSDVDGVLTDGGMYYSKTGDELKKFNTRDGMAFQLLHQAGIKTGIITSEESKIVENRAEKLRVDYLCQGKYKEGKLSAVKDICFKENISLKEIAYIGDDINCFDLLSQVGIAACPYDAIENIKRINKIIILPLKGGEGVFRLFVEKYIL
jgi:N-acylneuraminate cytidylyltransferase